MPTPSVSSRDSKAKSEGSKASRASKGTLISLATEPEIRVGDRAQRVTVPLPQTMDGLKMAAASAFKDHSGLYHHGKYKMHQEGHMKHIKHNDVIIVEKNPHARKYEEFPMSTHQSNYVEHPIEARKPQVMEPGIKTQPLKFEGESTYASGFVKHPPQKRAPAPQLKSAWESTRSGDPMEKSTYSQDYPRHEVKVQPRERSEMSPTMSPFPFEGKSSYANDFVKHPPTQPRQPVSPVGKTMDTVKFEGSSTYCNDFPQHELPKRTAPAAASAMHRVASCPFEGDSEYKREFLRHKIAQKQYVHIEPEIRRYPKGSTETGTRQRPKSAPNAPAAR